MILLFAGCHKNLPQTQMDLAQSSIAESTTQKDSRQKDSSLSKIESKTKQESKKCNAPNPKTSALLSFVGDNVLGDYKGASGDTFNAKFREKNGDFAYFSNGVREVLGSDDLTIGNMEGVLSDRELKNAFEKPFSFKGQSSYTQVLREASIEALNLANNHSRDYGAQWFADTKEHV